MILDRLKQFGHQAGAVLNRVEYEAHLQAAHIDRGDTARQARKKVRNEIKQDSAAFLSRAMRFDQYRDLIISGFTEGGASQDLAQSIFINADLNTPASVEDRFDRWVNIHREVQKANLATPLAAIALHGRFVRD